MPEKTFPAPRAPEASAEKLERTVPEPAQPQVPVDETTREAPVEAAPIVADVTLKSVADESVVVSVAAGKETFAPGEEKTVSAAFAEQASVLASVERV